MHFQVVPDWADGTRLDAWKELVKTRWLLEDQEFAAVARRNAKNRGEGGTHRGGNRSFQRFFEDLVCISMEQVLVIFCHVSYLIRITFLFVMQVAKAKPGEVITEMIAYDKYRSKRKDPKLTEPQLPEYYGNAGEHIGDYITEMKEKYPHLDFPLEEETDDDVVLLSGHGLEHGRTKCLNPVIRPRLTTSFTRLKSTRSSDSPPIPPRRQSRTSTHDVSFLFSTFVSFLFPHDVSFLFPLTRFLVFQIVA